MRREAEAILAMALLGAQPVLAAPSVYDQAFVTAFADACICGRLKDQTGFSGQVLQFNTTVTTAPGPELMGCQNVVFGPLHASHHSHIYCVAV